MDDETEIWSCKHYFFSSQLVLEASSIPGLFSFRRQYIPSLLKQIELGFLLPTTERFLTLKICG